MNDKKTSTAGEVSTIILLIVFIILYSLAKLNIVPQLGFLAFWPDALFYILINWFLATLWWGYKGQAESDVDKMSLASDVMGGTIRAGITATSIFIPLSLASIEFALTSDLTILSYLVLQHLIIAVLWFGLSTIIGLIALVYINELIGKGRCILKERRIGISTNLQLYAIITGVLRIGYAMYLIWGELPFAFN